MALAMFVWDCDTPQHKVQLLDSIRSPIPLVASDDCATVGTESYECNVFFSEVESSQTAYIHFSTSLHICKSMITCTSDSKQQTSSCQSVTDVSIVRPHYRFGIWTVMSQEHSQTFHHMGISYVPGIVVHTDHSSIITLRVLYDFSVLQDAINYTIQWLYM